MWTSACATAAAAATSSSSLSTTSLLFRDLQRRSEFQEFNEIFENARLILPTPIQVNERVGIATLDMTISRLECFDLLLGNVQVGDLSLQQQISLALENLDLTCDMDYRYSYGILRGSGSLTLQTRGNNAQTTLAFDKSPTGEPLSPAVVQCIADIKIVDMSFRGDFVSNIIEVFERLIRNVVQRQVGNAACEELASLGTDLLGNILELVNTQLEPFLEMDSDSQTLLENPMLAEEQAAIPDNAFKFQDESKALSQLLQQALEAIEQFLNAGNDEDGSMMMNSIIRNRFLNEQGVFVLEAEKDLNMDSSVLFQGHDKVLQTTIVLEQIEVLGLDSITTEVSLQTLGNHTLQAGWRWKELSIQVVLNMKMEPSTLDDAILQGFTSTGIQEKVVLQLGLEQVEILMSLLVLLDEPLLGQLQLGSLLQSTEGLMGCFLQVVQDVQVVALSANFESIAEPSVTGFVDVGLDRVLGDMVRVALDLYEPWMKSTILPQVFQSTMRPFLNDNMLPPILEASDECPIKSSQVLERSALINFEELFEGDTYGELLPMLKDMLDDQLLSTTDDSSNLLALNSALIGPLTKSQSGIEGQWTRDGDLLELFSEAVPSLGLEKLQVKAMNFGVKNLNQWVAPIQFMDPVAPQMLRNQWNVAPAVSIGENEMTVHVQGLLALQSNNNDDLNMSNQLDFSMSLAGSQWLLDLLARMKSRSFLQFPIVDITNLDCWLATFESPNGLGLDTIDITIPAMNLNVECSNCTSASLVRALPSVLTLLENSMALLEGRLVDMGKEVLGSDFLQAWIDRILEQGSLRCPHSPDFIDESAEAAPLAQTWSLSYNSLETIAFGASMLMHMGTAILAETFADESSMTTSSSTASTPKSDPLSAQKVLALSSSSNLVDFTKLDDLLNEYGGTSVQELVSYLNRVNDQGELRINSILRSSLLSEEGSIDVELQDLKVGGTDTEISLKKVRILGLDNLERVDFQILDSQTVEGSVSIQSLTLEVIIGLMGIDVSNNSKTSQDINFTVELGEIDLSLALYAAMDLDILGSLQLGSIMDMESILPCILSSAQEAKLTQLEVTVGAFDALQVGGFRDPLLEQASFLSSDIILGEYREKLLASMAPFFDRTVRSLVNNWFTYMVEEWASASCPTYSFERMNEFVDFRDLLLQASQALQLGGRGTEPYGNLFRTAVNFIKDTLLEIDPTSGLSAINDFLVEPWTQTQSETPGSLIFPGDLFTGGTRIRVGGLDARVELRASDARIDNLDTIGSPLDVLAASREPFHLNNTASLGVDATRPVQMGVRLLFALAGDDDIQIRNEVDANISLEDLTVILDAMIMVAESRFYDFPLRDAFDLNCWLATIPAPPLDAQGLRAKGVSPSVALAELAATVARVNVNISCIECSSPRMVELTDTVSSTKAQQDITTAVNDILDYVGRLAGGNFVQTQLDRILHDAARKCPHSPTYDADFEAVTYKPFQAPANKVDMSYLVKLSGVAIAFVVVVGLIVFGVRVIVRRRHKKWLRGLPPHQIRSIARVQSKEREVESKLNAATTSMFTSEEIPRWVRWGMPVVILCNVAFFLSGHLSLGATVKIEANIAGESIKVQKFFEFSMARSTIDIWNAGGKELAMMIFIFSGLWPYTKQFITLWMWFASPNRISATRRGSILLWLDWLAKWSMVDVFVLVVSIAAFRVVIGSPNVSFLPEDFYSVDMMVVPLWGLYANMIAQLISQISSHFIIYYHRRIVAHAQADTSGQVAAANSIEALKSMSSVATHRSESFGVGGENDTKEALYLHHFSRPHRGETEKVEIRRGVNGILCIGIFLLSILVILGCSIPSFALEFLGIVGVAVEFGQDFEDAITKHSIFTALKLLMDEARFLQTAADMVGLLSLSTLLFATVLIVPIAQSIALGYQWFASMSHQRRSRMAVLIEILQAWQFAEVFILAVFVASWQLGPVSQFMINSYCNDLEEFFAQAVHYGLLREEDAQCFSVQSSIENGFFLLAAGAAVLALINTFVNKAVNHYFRDCNSLIGGRSLESNVTMRDSGSTDVEEEQGGKDAGFSTSIQPLPVLFTDTFRWLLRGSNKLPGSSREILAGSGDGWDLPEAHAVEFNEESLDGSVVEGKCLSKGDDSVVKKIAREHYSQQKQGPSPSRYPAVASARRQLTYEDDISAMQPSVMGSISSQSVESDDWRSSVSGRSRLKDDRTYATPPEGRSRISSRPAETSSKASVKSMAGGSNASSSTDSSNHVPQETFEEEEEDEILSSTSSRPSTMAAASHLSNTSHRRTPTLTDVESRADNSRRSGSVFSRRHPQPKDVMDLVEESLQQRPRYKEEEDAVDYVEETIEDYDFEEYTVGTDDVIFEDDTTAEYEDASRHGFV